METHTHIADVRAGRLPVCLSLDQRLRHLAVLGATGVGKSTLLRHLAAQDMARGDGLLLLDPHGDLALDVLGDVPRWRRNHVCFLNLPDLDFPVALNVLDDPGPDGRAAAVDAVVGAMRAIWAESWGPRMETILRHAATVLMAAPGASLVQLPRLLTDDDFRARTLRHATDPLTQAFFARRFDAWRETYRDEVIDPVLNKIEAFLAFPAIRNVLGQSASTLHLDQALARGRIVIVKLAKGLIGETAAHLMGALLIARVQAAAMARASLPPSERRPFHLLIDEAQNFGTEAIGALLSEGRKYGLSLTIATQYLAALPERTRASLLGNAGTLIVFRSSSEDAALLAAKFDRTHQAFNPTALLELERGEALVRTSGEDARLLRLPPPQAVSPSVAVMRQSQRHYARRRDDIEARIMRALG